MLNIDSVHQLPERLGPQPSLLLGGLRHVFGHRHHECVIAHVVHVSTLPPPVVEALVQHNAAHVAIVASADRPLFAVP